MSGGASRQLKTREQIENDLAEDLYRKQLAWRQASDKDRDAARQQFIDALHRFNSFILYGKFLNP